MHAIAESFAKRVDQLANEVTSRINLGFMSFDSIYQPFEMEIINLCRDFGSSIRQFLNDVSSLVDEARQSIQHLVQTLKLFEEDLLLSSANEYHMLRVFGDTMVHCGDVLDTIDIVGKNASNQLSYDFRVSYCQQVLTIAKDMEMILNEVKDCLGSDGFDALSVLCVVCSTLDMVVYLQQASIDDAMATNRTFDASSPTTKSYGFPLTIELVVEYTRPASLEARSSFDGNKQCSGFNHVLTTAYGQVLAFAYVVFDDTVDSFSMEDTEDDSVEDTLLDDLDADVEMKDMVVESSSPAEFSRGNVSSILECTTYELVVDVHAKDSVADFLPLLLYNAHAPDDLKDVFDTSSLEEEFSHDDSLAALHTSDSVMEDPPFFASISEAYVPFDPGGTVSSSISGMLVTDECLVIVSPVSSNKTLQITNSIVQHSIETTMDCNKHFPPICFLDESLAMKDTFSIGLLDVESNCVGLPSGMTQPFLSSFLRGYEPFPLVKFKILQDKWYVFSIDTYENGDCIAVLSTAGTSDLRARLASVTFLDAGLVSSLLSRLKGIFDSIGLSSSSEYVLLVWNRSVVLPVSTLVFGSDTGKCRWPSRILLVVLVPDTPVECGLQVAPDWF